MSFPRLALLALGLPLLAGACGGPAAVAAVSYGADGVSLFESGKTTTDHFASMVSKKDCAFWRVFRNQNICRDREGDHDPYKVNYDSPERQMSEDGASYVPPLHSSPDAPATSWTAEAYKPASTDASPPAPAAPVEAAVPAVAEATPALPPPAAAKAATPHKRAKKAKAAAAPVKKASRGPAGSAS